MEEQQQYGERGAEGSVGPTVYHIDSRVSLIELIAAAAHQANRAYCIALDDISQPVWEDAPEWQRSSACNGVKAALDPDQTPEKSHEGWLKQKTEEGWRWGPVKDPELKLHPCFLPYGDLPADQRLKDDIFLTTVRSIAKAVGIL